jgi:hypothetical protein
MSSQIGSGQVSNIKQIGASHQATASGGGQPVVSKKGIPVGVTPEEEKIPQKVVKMVAPPVTTPVKVLGGAALAKAAKTDGP